MTGRIISAWPDPSALFDALGEATVLQKAGEGDRDALYSLGCCLVSQADGVAGRTMGLGAGGKSPKANVGLAAWHFTTERFRSLTTPRCVDVHVIAC
jgi:hypothetical protein